ncbi:hypothetical protein PS2_025324 [Malus domestica]
MFSKLILGQGPPCLRKSDRVNQNELLNNHLDDGFSSLSTGRRGLGLDVAGLSVKKTLFWCPKSFLRETPTIHDENKTPKVMPIFMPTTPSTVSVPMQTAMTPAPPPPVPFATNLVQEIPKEIEY